MPILKFSALDTDQMRLVFELAGVTGMLTPSILARASHVGELWEARSFLLHFGDGTAERDGLMSYLRSCPSATESITGAIARIAPGYKLLAERSDDDLDELLRTVRNTFRCRDAI